MSSNRPVKHTIRGRMVPTIADEQSTPSESRFELLIDALADFAIYMLDVDGRVATWNSGAERVTGHDRGEIVGQHFSRLFTPEDQANEAPARILAAARTDGRHEAEGWRVRNDGSRFWAHVISQAMRGPDGNLIGFAQVTRDLSEKVTAQHALLESERRFRVLVDGVVDYAIYMLDPSGTITNWNTGAERLKGYTADEI